MLLCLGIVPNVIPPEPPQKNPYVERYHRSYNQEWGPRASAGDPGAGAGGHRSVTARTTTRSDHERRRSCGNQPPRKAFPVLPRLPALPTSVNPDAWLDALQGQAFARRVGADGCVTVDHEPYYISQALAKQQVVLFVNAAERAFDVWLGSEGLKRIPIKGLQGAEMPLDQYIRLMQEQARSQERRLQLAHRRLRQLTLWG